MKKYLLSLVAICGIAVPLCSFAISTPSSFSLTSSAATGIQLGWQNPTDLDFYQTLLVRSNSSYPTGTLDGTIVISGTSTSYIDTGLSDGIYYYSIFAQDLSGNLSDPTTGFAILDTTDPSIIAYSPSGSLVSGIVYFNRDVQDAHINGGSIQLLISGDPNIFGLAYQNTIFPTDTATTQTLTQVVGGLRDQVRYRSSNIIDGYGNLTTTPPTMFEVDATNPTLTYISPIANGGSIVSGTDATLTIQAHDTHLSGGHIHALIGTTPDFDVTRPTGGLYHGGNTPYDTTGEGGITVSNLPVGTYYWYAWVTDIVGNYTSGAMQSFTVVAPTINHGGGGGGSISRDNCNGTDSSPSFYDGLCLADTGITKAQRQTLLTSYNSGAVASDAGTTLTIAGFIRDVFTLLDIPFHGTMPASYTNTPVSEKLFNKIVQRLGILFK